MHAFARAARVCADGAVSAALFRSFSESELVFAYIEQNDQRAFHELYRRLKPHLFAVARRRAPSSDVAHDLVQQAFLNAHAARHRFQLGSEFRPWITRIVVNLAFDHRRSARTRALAGIDPADLAAPSNADSSERSFDAALTRRALARLCPRQRQVVEMHWFEERSFPEVARALGEGLSAVKVRAHRAYRELRSALNATR